MRDSGRERFAALGFAGTDVGRKREENQDCFLAHEPMQLYVVADGMGGHAGGQIASRLATDAILSTLTKSLPLTESSGPRQGPIDQHPCLSLLSQAVLEANACILAVGQQRPELRGMGTTVTGAIIVDGHTFIAHVGDSRAYLLRDGTIEQLSEDHSLVNEQVKAGLITAEQARTSRFKNIITRSVGIDEAPLVDTLVVPARFTDVYLLCSDGLTNMVSDAELREMLEGSFLSEAPRRLIELANERGGDDNITVVVFSICGVD